MATKDETQQSLLNAIDAVAKKAAGKGDSTVAAFGEAAARLAEAWRTLDGGRDR